MIKARYSKMIAGDVIDVGNRYVLPIYRIHSFLMAKAFGADINPRGALNVEKERTFYIPLNGDETALNQLFDSNPGLKELVAELRNSL